VDLLEFLPPSFSFTKAVLLEKVTAQHTGITATLLEMGGDEDLNDGSKCMSH
jgi:hypothetical protein